LSTLGIFQGKLLLQSLLLISVASTVFGWIQFFLFPDLKPFTVWGWDMHLFRLAGTFLDPTFLGLIIVFGLVISISWFIKSREKKYLFITLFLLFSLAFTYARAAYLAFLGGIFVIAIGQKKFRKVFYFGLGLIVVALILPTARNHSIALTRTFSIFSRIENYREAILVFERFPAFGVGYDNLCIARNQFIGIESFSSHACSGSDSSLLLILATNGLVGFMVFVGSAIRVFRDIAKSPEFWLLSASGVALLVHSLFSNSLFFPWVMGYMAILLAVGSRGEVQS
jgi:O-antigen ligase